MVQYRFLEAQAPERPHVAAGLNHARLYGERGSGTLTALTHPGATPKRLSDESRWGTTFQVGVAALINETWFVDASLSKPGLKTRNTLLTGQTMAIKPDPVTVILGVGMRF